MFINSPPSLPMHYIWKEGPICLFNGVIDKRRYYAHRHAILALRGDEIEPRYYAHRHAIFTMSADDIEPTIIPFSKALSEVGAGGRGEQW